MPDPQSDAGRPQMPELLATLRQRRQRRIRHIENKLGRVLLCYVSHTRSIDLDDVYHFHRLVENVKVGSRITLLLNSPGGDIDVAEHLIHIVRDATCPSDPIGADLDIVVPNFAYSAGTLMVLGADRVFMGGSSALGPIDPQWRVQQRGSAFRHSVLDYVKVYESLERRCLADPDNRTLHALLLSLDPVTYEAMLQIKKRSQHLAENLLKRYGSGVNFTAAAAKLLDTETYRSHGQVIAAHAARSDIGLKNIKIMARTSERWKLYWQLYDDLRRVSDGRKIFESRRVSIIT